MSGQRRLLILALCAALLAVATSAAAFLWLERAWEEPWPRGNEARSVTVEVAAGSSGTEILKQLEAAGVLRSATTARLLLVHRLGDPPLRAGEYRFELPASSEEVIRRLVEGEVVTYPVTLIEGLTLQETAADLAGKGFGQLDAFLREMSDPRRILDLDPQATNLEGYLYPDTYSFARGSSEAFIVDTLIKTFRSRLQQVPPAQPPRSVRELVTLASIVEKEAQLDSERALIAGVYANRLRIGMALYADPTIIYGLKLEGRWDGNLRRQDLQIESPYNTYRVAGLPPTPICSPRLASLEAAARPSDEPYLYFVSRNDGSHVFARTLAEHNRNVDVWQKQYWRKRWQQRND